ncbi:MAG: peptidyl-prolyl cis-trans isomerase [Armatimonadetes bacterium]|nr:peptidyl-prolyl cis-trans isomerase [Armatimonadota bacterium]
MANETAVGNPRVALRTNLGEIVVELDRERAPITTENFLQYVRDKHYDGVIFHRVIPNFMIQGGGMNPGMQERRTRKSIQNEAGNGLRNDRGTIAMARTSVVDSATDQFFINLKDNGFLNHRDRSSEGFGYAVFGAVVEGMEVVDAIARVPTGRAGAHENVPRTAVVIETAVELT